MTREWWMVAVVAGWLAGACADDGEPGASETSGGGDGAGPGATLDPDGGPGGPDDGASGGAEESGYGMDDDMPLVASIPSIKTGEIGVGTLVEVRRVVVTSQLGELSNGIGYFVQDPSETTFAGIRVGEGAASPPERGEGATIVAKVDRDGAGPFLVPQSVVPDGIGGEPPPLRTDIAALAPGEPKREPLQDMVLMVVEGSGAPLTVGDELEPGVLALREGVVIDLDLLVDTPPLQTGALLEAVTGILVIEGETSVILPRGPEDLRLAK
ncbi:MAG: hypothetical protein H6712_23130 [Myxococcales bacterium]|nr:hypothetical protein [Myxococcales bacterium]MCB9716770.1 hypothetical protein [Myxococcales bacterium]